MARLSTAATGSRPYLAAFLLCGASNLPAAAQQVAAPQPGPQRQTVSPAGSPVQPASPGPNSAEPASETKHGIIHVAATLNPDGPAVRAGLQWRVFADSAAVDGTHKVVAQSADPQPSFDLPNGTYIVHATFGYASTMKRITVTEAGSTERLALNAGAIEVDGTLGDAAIPADRLSLAIYVPDHNNPEAKLVVSGAKPGQVICLPEGSYHIVSTYLDTEGVGSLTPVSDTNSMVSADLRVQAGKVLQATVKHRAAMETLKLVNAPGGEALANTSFTILTPGGDVIRELIGAFPSLVLAEGDYVAIARHDGRTFQSEFKVQSALDRDVEIIAH